jgi:Xaa-Pro aminopeptidase
MFAKETYVQRRARLKKTIGSGVLLFLGNDEQGLNYEDNTFRYRQDSTFLYYFGLSFAGLSALIDIDEDKEIIFGDELTIDHIIWMGISPPFTKKLLPWAFPKPVLLSTLSVICTRLYRRDRPSIICPLIVPSIN